METLRLYRWIGTALALAGAVATAEAQNLERMAGAANGPVRFAYPAAENVCGTGDGVLIREPDGSTMFVSGHVSARGWREWRRGSVPCETGDVVVGLTPGRDGWEDVTMGVGVPGESEEAGGADARDLGHFGNLAFGQVQGLEFLYFGEDFHHFVRYLPALDQIQMFEVRHTGKTSCHWFGNCRTLDENIL